MMVDGTNEFRADMQYQGGSSNGEMIPNGKTHRFQDTCFPCLGTLPSVKQPSIADQINTIDVSDDAGTKKTTTLLIEIGSLFELFHDARGECYAAVYDGDKKSVYRLSSRDFSSYLRQCYFRCWQKGVSDKHMPAYSMKLRIFLI